MSNRSYQILNALDPQEFLHPERFATTWPADMNPEFLAEKRREGLEISRGAERVYISAHGTWGADGVAGKGRVWTTSYEGIGFHAGTSALLEGFLAGPAPVDVIRIVDGEAVTTRIKEATEETEPVADGQ